MAQTFTLFIILPNDDVCSLRRLASGATIKDVRKALELSAGLPADTYGLTSGEGQGEGRRDGGLLGDDHELRLHDNVWEGFLLRAVFLRCWQHVYNSVLAGDVDHVIQQAASPAGLAAEWREVEDREVLERGAVALFVASCLGLRDVCQALLSVGVNPDHKTPFGRTPLFAALAQDKVHVMDLLLSYNATLQTRDSDGRTALDIARSMGAKECVRKARHLQFHTRTHSAPAACGQRPADGAPVPAAASGVIRIPTGAMDDHVTSPPASSGKAPVLRTCGRGSEDQTEPPSAGARTPDHRQDVRARTARAASLDTATVGLETGGGQRPTPSALFSRSVVYAWQDNLTSLSRASSAAGTHLRVPVPAGGGGPLASRGRAWHSRGTAGADDTTRRPHPQDVGLEGLSSVLTVSTPSRTPTPVPLPNPDTEAGQDGSGLKVNQLSGQEEAAPCPTHLQEAGDPHAPAQEPPERPPSRQDTHVIPSGSAADASGAPQESDCAKEGDREAATSTACRDGGGGDGGGGGDQGPSAPTATSAPSAVRVRFREPVLRRKHQQSPWKTRLQLAVGQKRKSTVTQKTQTQGAPHPSGKDPKEHFERWLARKRKEKERELRSDDDTSSDDDVHGSPEENARAFRDWLRELKERPLRRPNPCTPASLHRRKTRPLKYIIQVGVSKEEAGPTPDPDSYMTAYRQWRQQRQPSPPLGPLSSQTQIQGAKTAMEEKRRSLLAAALTYEEWLDHQDQRQRLQQAVVRAETDKASVMEQNNRHISRACWQTSSSQWRNKTQDKEEAETRQEKHRAQRKAENGTAPTAGDGIRSSAAIAHHEWLKRKKQSGAFNSSTSLHASAQLTSRSARSASSDEDRRAAWEAWLQDKHREEVAHLDQRIRKERQLLFTLRSRTAAVTH